MKKFSKLQQFILLETHRRHYISNPDILIKWFGFKPSRRGALNFAPGAVGVKKYKSASVSVARSLTRLRNRGLIRRFNLNGHHELTQMGRQLINDMGNIRLEISHYKKR